MLMPDASIISIAMYLNPFIWFSSGHCYHRCPYRFRQKSLNHINHNLPVRLTALDKFMRFERGLESKATLIDDGAEFPPLYHASYFAQYPSMVAATLSGDQRQQDEDA